MRKVRDQRAFLVKSIANLYVQWNSILVLPLAQSLPDHADPP